MREEGIDLILPDQIICGGKFDCKHMEESTHGEFCSHGNRDVEKRKKKTTRREVGRVKRDRKRLIPYER